MVKYFSTPDQTPISSRTRDFIRKSLLPNFLNAPEDFFTHITKCAFNKSFFILLSNSSISAVGGSILSFAYGLPVKKANDPLMAQAQAGVECITATAVPGKYVVDVLPFLRYLPEWFPGATFHREAAEGRKLMRRFFREPFEAVKKGMVSASLPHYCPVN